MPHLTVAANAGLVEMRAAADAVMAKLPVRARVSAAWLYVGTDEPDGWRPVRTLPLGS